jgi:glycosyltransferase involved in cell wall biosynthesis
MRSASPLLGVSFVVPVHNGVTWIRETIEAILAQADGRPMEVIVIDDRSEDESSTLLLHLAAVFPIRVIPGEGRGAAAALNAGVRAARHPIVCQVDQDVVVGPGWMQRLTAEFRDPAVAAAQGYFATNRHATLCARVMGLDLEQRYAAIRGTDTDHVCTGNSAYRADALRQVGLFDETLGYGYDNDMSYRLREAGCRLVFCRDARSIHRWREGLSAYLVQQYGLGYGRLDLIAKHPTRLTGDSVSPPGMMIHAPLMLITVASLLGSVVMEMAGGPWRSTIISSAIVFAALAAERLIAGLRAAGRFGDPAGLLFPIFHAARDLMWVAAIVTWSARRLRREPASPSHSMRVRRAPNVGRVLSDPARQSMRTIGVIPAHNEAANLESVVADLTACRPDIEILVIDDGSTDETAEVLERLGVRAIRFPERMGIGSAMRAGLRYASRLGFDVAVRLDGDGQHRAADIELLLSPVFTGAADVVLGSRYSASSATTFKIGSGPPQPAREVRLKEDTPSIPCTSGMPGPVRRALAACLTALTGRRITDPTSGFCAFGPRAIRMLGDHHPTGYPEPELQLFLSRNGLTVVEVAVQARSRLSGKTSLTPARVTLAGARVLLAMLIVPLRDAVEDMFSD